ncbi:hypothetical protein AB9K34_08200 [Sedimentitalea sp. XS_ASV28]|uniref:hypothetical protein n=1 Tax=Sedimentitalea sp. XS_ASV28 TaxID=3241296 RepID=UPI0035124405
MARMVHEISGKTLRRERGGNLQADGGGHTCELGIALYRVPWYGIRSTVRLAGSAAFIEASTMSAWGAAPR